MKRLLIVCMMGAMASMAGAQEIKVKKIRKVNTEEKVFRPEFSEKNHILLLEDSKGEQCLQYNARTRRTSAQEEPAAKAAEKTYPTVGVNKKQMQLQLSSSESRNLAPVGDHFYLWASLSPDGKRILFNAAGKGSYISDLEGKVLHELGHLNAPRWINQEWVVGMDDQDDGHHVETSELYAIHASTGKKSLLTESFEGIAMYPAVSGDSRRIAFSDQEGGVFQMKIKTK